MPRSAPARAPITSPAAATVFTTVLTEGPVSRVDVARRTGLSSAAVTKAARPFIEAWGSGEVSREFLYVEDCAEALVRAAAVYNESEPVNIGTGQEVLIKDLVNRIARLSKFDGEVRWQQSKPDGQPRRRLDVSRAFEKFGFRATTSLEDGLRRTIDSYEQNATVSLTQGR